jgi:hypothetical protein
MLLKYLKSRLAVTTIVTLITLIAGIATPKLNWDIIGYVATIKSESSTEPADIHAATFDDVKKSVDQENFSSLIDKNNNYRNTVYNDPQSLIEQIPFYKIRIAYIESVKLIHKTGLSITESTYYVSAICAAISIILISTALSHLKINSLWLPIIVIPTGISTLSQFSTPDAMASMAAIACVVALMQNKSYGLIIAALLPAIRTDYIIFSTLICIFYFYVKNIKSHSIIALFISILIYLIIQKSSGNYGWWTLFHFTLIEANPYPSKISSEISIGLFLGVYLDGLKSLFMHHHVLLFVACGWIFYKQKSIIKIPDYQLLIVLPAAYIILHWLAFPMYETRFFAFAASIMSIGLIKALTQKQFKI